MLGWVFVGWVVVSPPLPGLGLPNGADLELEWTWFEHVLASVTAVVGVALLVAAIVGASRRSALRIAEQPPIVAAYGAPTGPATPRGCQGRSVGVVGRAEVDPQRVQRGRRGQVEVIAAAGRRR